MRKMDQFQDESRRFESGPFPGGKMDQNGGGDVQDGDGGDVQSGEDGGQLEQQVIVVYHYDKLFL